MGINKSSTLSKRSKHIVLVVILWLVMGGLSVYTSTSLSSMGLYFSSLLVCVASYNWGETKRSSKKPTKKIPRSEREIMMYVTTGLWFGLGLVAIFYGLELKACSAYFGPLNGFVASYIVGKTYKGGDGETILKS